MIYSEIWIMIPNRQSRARTAPHIYINKKMYSNSLFNQIRMMWHSRRPPTWYENNSLF